MSDERTSDPVSWVTAVGLALVYASAYVFPLLRPRSAYFLPSMWAYVFWPALVAVVVFGMLIVLLAKLLNNYRNTRWYFPLILTAIALITLLAVKVSLDAADLSGFRIVVLLTGAEASPNRLRVFKVGVIIGGFVATFVTLYSLRGHLQSWVRFLSILGFAFLFLAVFRISSYGNFEAFGIRASTGDVADTKGRGQSSDIRIGATSGPTDRKVVWVIFDEMDYEKTLGRDSTIREKLTNFVELAAKAVSAEQAYPPAHNTAESIPALLMGQPVVGMQVRGPRELELILPNSTRLRFGLAGSVFSRLPGGPRSASVLGYFHPYCQIFTTLGYCSGHYLGNAGRWFDGLTFFSQAIFSWGRRIDGFVELVPQSWWRSFDQMFRVTESIVDDLSIILGKDEQALTFIHVTLPHLPGTYGQKVFGLPRLADDREIYKQNMIVADWLMGRIIELLQASVKRPQLLLIVSSDHWLRLDSQRHPRPVPFIAWIRGDPHGQRISQHISTVHTASLVLDFLNGQITSQTDITEWWQDKATYPTSIPDKRGF